MEDILHDLGCINLVNNGISYLSTGGAHFVTLSPIVMIQWNMNAFER